jgi:uncharacterized damage-inducible protein DinB
MTVAELQRLYDYSYWASRKLMQVVLQLKPDQFSQDVAGSYGSIKNTLVHVVSAEWGWLDRCGGHPRGPALKAGDYPTAESLVTLWNTVEGYVREFQSTLTDDDLARVIEYTSPRGDKRSGVLGHLLQHAAIHGAHHRGQVALLLRALGYAPGNFDLLFYDAEKSSALAW